MITALDENSVLYLRLPTVTGLERKKIASKHCCWTVLVICVTGNWSNNCKAKYPKV
jgi:hypothetical protein